MAEQAALANVLLSTLSPDAAVRRQAERDLTQAQAHPSFGPLVLQLAQDAGQQKPVRQSAALNFKNWIKANWALEEAPTPLSTQTAESLKQSIVAIMISLSGEPALQIQVGEAIAIMAESDFPDQWDNLIDQLTSQLTADNFVVNNAVLQTAHSIFRSWRAEFRTDALFTVINFVLARFSEPYLKIFQQTDSILSSGNALPADQEAILHRTLLLLLQIYYDLNSQDLPEFFEDRLAQFMPLLLKYLDYAPASAAAAAEDDEDEEAGDLESAKAEICEIAQLYSLRYLDAFGEGGFLGPFVEKTWGLLTKLGPAVKYDTLVAKATAFLGTVVKMPSQRTLFESQQTLEAFCEKIVLPNMTLRTFEEELFEDDPAEYVRRDLETAGSETRRQAASDFNKALMEQFEAQITQIVTQYIGAYLQQYAANPQENWKSKDTAIFLLTSIATRGSTQLQGVTSTNALVDVIKFFSDHVLADLQAAPGTIHPVVQADAIKFLYTFRMQLTKEQLLSVLPLLTPHLQNPSFVIHTYAALTIERILFIKQEGSPMFGQTDIQDHAEGILMALFKIIESGTSPQQIAANEHLMKSAMRVIVTARQSLASKYSAILQHLVAILGEISKNPSNPKFNHFTFESISALVRFVTAAEPSSLAAFESALFPPFQTILSQDISEFTPFVFQILSQLLELHPLSSGLPNMYSAILPPLLTPTLWESRGNVPALVRLLRAFLGRGAEQIVAAGQVTPMLGIFQHLCQSKANDQHGFDLLQALLESLPTSVMQPYMSSPVFVLLLTRLQGSKTDKFSQGLLKFIAFAAAIQKNDLTPDQVIGFVDGVQPGLFGQVLPVLLPEVQKVPMKDRKLVAVGLSNLLTKSPALLNEPNVRAWTPTLEALLKLFNSPMPLAKNTSAADADEVDVVDPEDVGYQASYSKLGASEKPRADPVAYVQDPQAHLAKGLEDLGRSHPGKVPALMQGVPPELATPFAQYLRETGIQLA
ncbi:hypothetical protein JCM8202_002291 [Rhodotorula sphaerocarpa]